MRVGPKGSRERRSLLASLSDETFRKRQVNERLKKKKHIKLFAESQHSTIHPHTCHEYMKLTHLMFELWVLQARHLQ